MSDADRLKEAEHILYALMMAWDDPNIHGDEEYERAYIFLGLPERMPEFKAHWLSSTSSAPTQEPK